jgi:hypothetical protein
MDMGCADIIPSPNVDEGVGLRITFLEAASIWLKTFQKKSANLIFIGKNGRIILEIR